MNVGCPIRFGEPDTLLFDGMHAQFKKGRESTLLRTVFDSIVTGLLTDTDLELLFGSRLISFLKFVTRHMANEVSHD